MQFFNSKPGRNFVLTFLLFFFRRSRYKIFFSLSHRRTPHGRRAHLCEDPVQPLERSVEVELDPAGCRCYRLPPVFGAPTLDEAHSNGAHPGIQNGRRCYLKF